jgi:hypothetical protein
VRDGNIGAQYPNRSDLRSPGNTTVGGQEYGQRAAQQAAQQAVPITPPPNAANAVPRVPAGGQPPPAGPGAPQPGTPLAPGGPGPGELTDLFAPTERPGEPVTTGVDIGPGAGREALNSLPIGMVANNLGNGDSAAALLANLARRPDAGATIQNLARIAVNGPIR